MKNRKKVTSKVEENEFDALKKIGLEFESPQDEYSYQPASGSIIGGKIGEQEYGIKSVYNADKRHPQTGEHQESEDGENPDSVVPGESGWSLEHRLPEDERLNTLFEPEDLGGEKNKSAANQALKDMQNKKGKATKSW